ncbi:unnamed protein product [Mucor fragilis]
MYLSQEAPNLNSNNNNNEDHSANNKNLQSCIHYASRLIKLRSELRSPSYMNRSNSISESGGDTVGRLFYKSNCTAFGSGRNGRNSSLYELSSTHKSSILDHKSSSNCSTGHSPSLLSDIGRAQSLPNVAQQHDLYHYDKEDESEIFCHHHNRMAAATALPKASDIENDDEQDDEASQLTYLSDLVRASLRRRQTHFHEASDHLALPPRHHFHHAPNKERRPRSISLRDMINEAIDEAIQSSSANDNATADKPTVLRNSQSFTLASQLLFHASQNSSSPHQQRHQTDQEKGQEQQQPLQEQEKENLFLDSTNVKNSLAVANDKFKEVFSADNSHPGAFDEKVEIPSQATARARSSTTTTTTTTTNTNHQCNKQDMTTHTTSAPTPQPSKSRDNKSLFSFISSDSEPDEDEEEDDTKTSLSIHSFNKRIIQKRRLQKRPQAFLVSISPSSAAAASVARSRRSKTKQAIRAHHHLNSLLH